MSWRTLVSKHTFNKLPIINAILHSPFPRNASIFPSPHHTQTPSLPIYRFTRYLHSTRLAQLSNSLIVAKPETLVDDDDEDGTMNEFLSRFVWIMRKKVKESYPDSDKRTIDAMLLIIVQKVALELEKGGFHQILDATTSFPSEDFSEDLWKTVWEVSNVVLEDMNKERKKERMKGFLQCEEVKEMCRFAGEVGIRGDLLRELRFKWAREKMEEHDFYEGLERLKKEAETENEEKKEEEFDVVEEKAKVVALPKRKGKIRFKIYGLDLSDPKWAQVADKINEAGQVMWPQEPKAITGKCKLVTEKILSLKEEELEEEGGLTTLLAEWVELLQPSRVDWMNLLDRLKQRNYPLYLKVCQWFDIVNNLARSVYYCIAFIVFR